MGRAVADVQGQLVKVAVVGDGLVLLGVAGGLGDGVQVNGGLGQGRARDGVDGVPAVGGGGQLVDGLAGGVGLDGVKVGVDGHRRAGQSGHLLAVVGGVLPLGGEHLALGVVGAKVGVAVGHADDVGAVGGVKELEVVEIGGDDGVPLDDGHSVGKVIVVAGGGVGLADLQAVLDRGGFGGFRGSRLGRSGLGRGGGGGRSRGGRRTAAAGHKRGCAQRAGQGDGKNAFYHVSSLFYVASGPN